MKRSAQFILLLAALLPLLALAGLSSATAEQPSASIIFLHHSTGQQIWDAGVPEWFQEHNNRTGSNYQITERNFPQDSPYGWENYPYDYYNIWVAHAGNELFKQEPTLEMLTQDFEVIVFKHCFPVGDIEEDIGEPDVNSSDKRLENYKLQYQALKAKMREFPETKFIVLTGAAQTKANTDPERGQHTRSFFEWVKTEWDEKGDNIFVWDFYELETEGGIFLKNNYAMDKSDSHPNNAFSRRVAPLFCQRIVEVIEGNGDSQGITGE